VFRSYLSTHVSAPNFKCSLPTSTRQFSQFSNIKLSEMTPPVTAWITIPITSSSETMMMKMTAEQSPLNSLMKKTRANQQQSLLTLTEEIKIRGSLKVRARPKQSKSASVRFAEESDVWYFEIDAQAKQEDIWYTVSRLLVISCLVSLQFSSRDRPLTSVPFIFPFTERSLPFYE
jgi:hypothetical protein